MAAGINDRFTDAFNATNPNVARVVANRTAGSPTLACDNLAGWPTDTAVHFLTYEVDTSNEVVPNTQIDWKGIVTGDNIGTMTRLAGAADGGNSIGEVVKMNPTASWVHDLMMGILASHNQDGTLKNDSVATSNIQNNAVTVLKIPDDTITPAKQNATSFPYGRIYFTHASASTGGVIIGATETVIPFGAFEANSHTGITKPENGYLQVDQDGVYLAILQTMVNDSPKADALQAIRYLDPAETVFELTSLVRADHGQDNRGNSTSAATFLTAGSKVYSVFYSGGGSTRVAPEKANQEAACSLTVIKIA